MAKMSAKTTIPPPPMVGPIMPMAASKVSAKVPHGMSLAVRPERPRHAVHKNRDAYGRMLPGQTPPGAVPFAMNTIPAQAAPMPVKTKRK